jgi:hypothetical protein
MATLKEVIKRAIRPMDRWLARRGEKARLRVDPLHRHRILLDYAPSASPQPRWGYGKPPHVRMFNLMAAHHERYGVQLNSFLEFRQDLLRIPLHADRDGQLCWVNTWLPGLDIISLYSYVRGRDPSRYVEIGSGTSTMVAHMARTDSGGSVEITSIDPHPRHDIDHYCDVVVRSPLELVDQGIFASLRAGDIIFLDGSHRIFTASDMTVFYMEVLPELPQGVVVGIHDILWPDDYLPEWQEYWFSEQYVLGAYLLAGAPWIDPLLASSYVSSQPALQEILLPYWDALPGVDRRGSLYWFTVTR